MAQVGLECVSSLKPGYFPSLRFYFNTLYNNPSGFGFSFYGRCVSKDRYGQTYSRLITVNFRPKYLIFLGNTMQKKCREFSEP